MGLEVLDIRIEQLILESESQKLTKTKVRDQLASKIPTRKIVKYQKMHMFSALKIINMDFVLEKNSQYFHVLILDFFKIIDCNSTVTAAPSINRISALSPFTFFQKCRNNL